MISKTGTLTDFDAFRKTLREFHPDEGTFFSRSAPKLLRTHSENRAISKATLALRLAHWRIS
jgi:hypothetical protein